MKCPLDQPSAATEIRAGILNIHVRLAQGIQDFPEGAIYTRKFTDAINIPLANGGHFGNIYRICENGRCLALKEPRILEGSFEMPVRLPAALARAAYSK